MPRSRGYRSGVPTLSTGLLGDRWWGRRESALCAHCSEPLNISSDDVSQETRFCARHSNEGTDEAKAARRAAFAVGTVQYGTGSSAACCSGASEPFAAGSGSSAFAKMEKSIFRKWPATIETPGMVTPSLTYSLVRSSPWTKTASAFGAPIPNGRADH
jgi:hypothetical protein